MKAMGLAVGHEDGWRNIPISLIDLGSMKIRQMCVMVPLVLCAGAAYAQKPTAEISADASLISGTGILCRYQRRLLSHQRPSRWFVRFDGTLQMRVSAGTSMRFERRVRPVSTAGERHSTTRREGGTEQVCVEPYSARPVAENHHSWLRSASPPSGNTTSA
jgi:hypothetical protein